MTGLRCENPAGTESNAFFIIKFGRVKFIFSTLLVVGDCLRCYARCTNTTNGGWLATDRGEETPTRAVNKISIDCFKIFTGNFH
jgi:hypothetical protein